MEEGGSLREHQRLETRQRLLDTAQQLVSEHGYSGTTVAQIAQAAGVTERTFFRHFESKTDLFLTNWRTIASSMEGAMRELPAITPVFDVAVAGLCSFARGAQTIIDKEEPATMDAFANNVPVLAMFETVLALEEVLSSTLAWRLGLDAEQVEVRSVANATVGVLRATIRSYSIGNRKRPLPRRVVRTMELLRPLYAEIADAKPLQDPLRGHGKLSRRR